MADSLRVVLVEDHPIFREWLRARAQPGCGRPGCAYGIVEGLLKDPEQRDLQSGRNFLLFQVRASLHGDPRVDGFDLPAEPVYGGRS